MSSKEKTDVAVLDYKKTMAMNATNGSLFLTSNAKTRRSDPYWDRSKPDPPPDPRPQTDRQTDTSRP
jgi:hypothetical protein